MALNLVLPELDDQWSPGEHTGTFRGQNLSFVAGKVALDYFDGPELMNEVDAKIELMKTKLQPLLNSDPSLELRGKGMIMGLDIADTERAAAIVKQCFNDGLIIASCGIGGRGLKLIPPLTIDEADLNAGLDILVNATHRVMEVAA